jgi:hypothetical protein
MPNKPEEQNAPKMISKGPNKQGMDWGPRSPVIYTSVTEGDPDLKQPMALGVIDEDEVGLIITHSNEQITIDINDYRYTDQSVAIEKWGGKLRILVWADPDDPAPYIIDFKETETEPEEAK